MNFDDNQRWRPLYSSVSAIPICTSPGCAREPRFAICRVRKTTPPSGVQSDDPYQKGIFKISEESVNGVLTHGDALRAKGIVELLNSESMMSCLSSSNIVLFLRRKYGKFILFKRINLHTAVMVYRKG